jgi:thioredoxin 1
MSHVIELTAESFEKEVLQSEIPVLVDFWAPWCGPCRMMAPILDELSVEMAGLLKMTKLNVDESAHQELATKYRVQGIPNMQIFRGGKVIKEIVGARPKEFLMNELKGL